jgi:cytochrome c peroxidase
MRLPLSWALRGALLLLPAVVLLGCQKARTYDPRRGSKALSTGQTEGAAAEKAPARPIPQDYAWINPGRFALAGDPRIEFVHEGTQPEEWKKLKGYWTEPALAPLVAPGLPGAAVLAAVKARAAVRIKVPLGLEDPLAFIPAANPPTRGKWELGRRLFFDRFWLTALGDQSCASCHVPANGFTDRRGITADSYNTPTLINCVYSTHQFWDGRATYLEEVVQRTLEDESEPKEPGPFRHVWHGVIGRLRKSDSYQQQFHRVFSTAPTQDTVGQAIATYLRTLLAGDSLHDRAVQEQNRKGARTLAASHYEAVLDDRALKELGREKGVKAVVAGDLLRGYTLFTGKAGCAGCHPPGNGCFSDSRFYNIGLEEDEEIDRPGGPIGRFAWAPSGERTRSLRGAFKTPTLRSLLRTGPYFHNGQEDDLTAVVRFHVRRPKGHSAKDFYLDPKLADDSGRHRDFGLDDEDVAVLVLFLKALNGGEVDRILMTSPK